MTCEKNPKLDLPTLIDIFSEVADMQMKHINKDFLSNLSTVNVRRKAPRKRAKMKSQEKPKLVDFQQSVLDIISELMDRQMEHIAEDIFSNVSEIDIANAVAANPKWSAIATNSGRIKKLFSRNKERAPLRAFYRREELLARRTQDQIDARSVFLQACIKCSELANRSQVEPDRKRGDFCLELPLYDIFPCTKSQNEEVRTTIHISDRLLVTVTSGVPRTALQGKRPRGIHLVQLFDRWTFQLVNSITLACNDLSHRLNQGLTLRFMEDDSMNAMLITRFLQGKRRAFFWDLTTSKLHALPCSGSIRQALCVSKLIILIWLEGENVFATVYKVQVDETDDIFVCIVDRERLHSHSVVWDMPGVEGLDCFAICAKVYDASPNVLFQTRSKEDFSLLRAVAIRAPIRDNRSFLLSERFFIYFNDSVSRNLSIDVVWLATGRNVKTVYKFCLPSEMRLVRERLEIVDNFLVLYSRCSGILDAAIWKLPSDFIETCRRHFEAGTVGVKSACDQRIVESSIRQDCSRVHQVKCRFDRLGIFKCHAHRDEPAVVHVSIINSIISDEKKF